MRLKRDTQRKARSGTILRLKRAQLLSSSDPYNCHQFVPSAQAPELEHETVNCPLFVPVCRLGLSPCRFRGSRLDAFHHCHKSLSSCDWDSQLQYSQRTFAAPLMQLFALNWSFLRLSPKQICIIWAFRSGWMDLPAAVRYVRVVLPLLNSTPLIALSVSETILVDRIGLFLEFGNRESLWSSLTT